MAIKRSVHPLQGMQDLFSLPDVNIFETPSVKKVRKSKSAVPKVPASKARPPVVVQPFLPGLSRRGRPRALQPISAVDRTAEHRRKRLAAGARRVEVILSPVVAQGLDTLAEHYQEARSEIVAALILKAVAQLHQQPRKKPEVQVMGHATDVHAS